MYIGDPMPGFGGHCCRCSGVCYHIGGPYDCGNHRDYVNVPYIPWTLPTERGCEHCYCKTLKETIPHERCCNCGHRRKK